MQDDDVSSNGDDKPDMSNNSVATATVVSNEAIKPPSSLVDMSGVLCLYTELSPIASSNNTLVFTAVTQQTKRKVAVKKIYLRNNVSVSSIKNALREVKILRRLDHDNIVRISNVVLSTQSSTASSSSTSRNSLINPKNTSSEAVLSTSSVQDLPAYDALYLEMELVDIDLRSILDQRKLSLGYVKLFSYQLLRGLKYIHSANIIHRDLTPANLFINIDTLMLKIGDFGISRVYDPIYKHTNHLSITTASTWYQSPEMIICPGHYDQSVDIWAVGCIIAEMCLGSPLFAGSHSIEQIDLIRKCISITNEDCDSLLKPACSESDCYQGDIQSSVSNEGKPINSLSELLHKTADADLLDLISGLLVFEPNKRMSIAQALEHCAFDSFKSPHDEPVCSHAFHIEDELDDYPLAKFQNLLKSWANDLVSADSSGVEAAVSTDDVLRASLKSSAHGGTDNNSSHNNKNLLELVRDGSSSNPSGSHKDCVMSESEARKMACDFDYGVQIADGSVNRDRMLMDWRPVSPETACFDPYKWNQTAGDDKKKIDEQDDAALVSSIKTINKPVTESAQDAASHSDHGYHSSYCSSNLSSGKPIHSHSLWSLSSPDISIDHEHRTPVTSSTAHRSATPDTFSVDASSVVQNNEHREPEQQHSSEQVPSRFQSPTTSVDDLESSSKWRRKDEVIPHHHQSFHAPHHLHHHHHHHHHHGHHHHHHHHHKHHRHSSRHGTSSSQSNQRSGSGQDAGHQRRCLVEDVVPEVAEENVQSSSGNQPESSSGPAPSAGAGCKREKRHHRNGKSSHHHHHHQVPKVVDTNAADTKKEKDFYKREPGYHEHYDKVDSNQKITTNHDDDDVSNMIKQSKPFDFPWASTIISATSVASNAAITDGESEVKGESTTATVQDQLIKPFHSGTCASQLRIESLELGGDGTSTCRITSTDDQKKTKRHIPCPY